MLRPRIFTHEQKTINYGIDWYRHSGDVLLHADSGNSTGGSGFVLIRRIAGLYSVARVRYFCRYHYLRSCNESQRNGCDMTSTTIELQSTLTCSKCGHKKIETMPTEACWYYYDCEGCGELLKPMNGHCCVFCSYGTVACPPIQESSITGNPSKYPPAKPGALIV